MIADHFATLLCVGLLATLGCNAEAHRPAPEGAELFMLMCARCHSADGHGGVTSPGKTAPRNFREQAFHEARTDAQLLQVIHAGKGDMPAFGGILSAEQLDSLVRHLRTFASEATPIQNKEP